MNRVTLIGRLGTDPVITTPSGMTIAKFRMVTSETWTDKSSGEKKEKVQWHQIVCMNANLSKIMEKYLKKGMEVLIEGQIQYRSWEQDGVTKYMTEIILQGYNCQMKMFGGGSKSNDHDDDRGSRNSGQDRSDGYSSGYQSPNSRDTLDDDIPF